MRWIAPLLINLIFVNFASFPFTFPLTFFKMPKTIYLDFFLSKKIKSETMPSVKGNFQFKLFLPYILKIIF